MLKRLVLAAALVAAVVGGAGAFELKSPDVAAGAAIPMKFALHGYGCRGENLSPALNWRDPPKGTKSFALLLRDPDAPMGGEGFAHWTVFNIPASATSLPQGAGTGRGLPAGATQAANDFGGVGYGGPCPPRGAGPHHYRFTLYALDASRLDLRPGASPARAQAMIEAHALGKAILTAVFGR